MRFRDLDSAQRAHEHYHDLAVPLGAWIIVRVDGRAFTTLTASRYQKPYDLRFAEIMAMTGAALLTEFDALYAYTQSDEISLLLPRDTEAFGRGVEKLVSLSAATASATFTHVAGHVGCFDARPEIRVQPEGAAQGGRDPAARALRVRVADGRAIP